MFPRLAAVAEVAWAEAENRQFGAFLDKLIKQHERYAAMDIVFRQPIPPASRNRPITTSENVQ